MIETMSEYTARIYAERCAGTRTWPNLHTWTAGDSSTIRLVPLDDMPDFTGADIHPDVAQMTIDRAHAHEASKDRATGMWSVTGPGGYWKQYHTEDEAEAIAAFWSGDMVAALEFRRKRLIARGLIKDEG